MGQEANRYQPPQSDVALDVEALQGEPASRGRRFGTFVVDYLCFLAVSFAIGMVIVLLFGEEGMEALEKVPDIVLGLVIFSSYYLLFEGVWARTPGKWVFGTIVVGEDGKPPSFGQVAGRTACRWIPFEALSCLGERGWHDSIPKTRVLRYLNP